MPKIWFRKSKNAYYLQIDRHTQKRLGKTKAEAEVAYRQWLIEEGETLPKAEQKKLTVAELAQDFLDDAKAKRKPKTYEFYCLFVCQFVERFGAAPAADFPLRTFEKWLDSKGWKKTRRHAIISILALFNWAVKKRILPSNPLKGIEIPPRRKRRRILTPAEREYVLGLIRDRFFRRYVEALLETGCRPGELAVVSAEHVSSDGTHWVLSEHKTEGKTGEARTIYLSPGMQKLTKELMQENPTGPLFRSTRIIDGIRQPFTMNAVRCRFRRLRKKVAQLRAAEKDPAKREKIPDLSGVSAYVLRHTYTTQALLNGLPVPVVAALLGHRSIRMVDEVYSHVDQRTQELKDAARKAVEKPNG